MRRYPTNVSAHDKSWAKEILFGEKNISSITKDKRRRRRQFKVAREDVLVMILRLVTAHQFWTVDLNIW